MIISNTVKIPCQQYEKAATVYFDDSQKQEAAILYFHGGGLIYGSRTDLPEYHIKSLCSAGFAIVALDYVLAPAARIDEIVKDAASSVDWFLETRETLFSAALPYFLWGRSAGAYLCLLMLKEHFPQTPAGIISYYGYGLLCDGWFNSPSEFYNRYPLVSKDCLGALSTQPCAFLSIDSCFPAYVHLRQTGGWSQLFAREDGSRLEDTFSLRDFVPDVKIPSFFAHSTNDTDVPFSEFTALVKKFPDSRRNVVSAHIHDFDRDTDSPFARALIDDTLSFIQSSLPQ